MRYTLTSLLVISIALLLGACATTEAPSKPKLGADIPRPEVVAVPVAQERIKYPEEPNLGGVHLDPVDVDVEVIFIVETDGTVKEAETEDDTRFGRAAIETLKKWRFQPATTAGVPVRSSYQVTISFGVERVKNDFRPLIRQIPTPL